MLSTLKTKMYWYLSMLSWTLAKSLSVSSLPFLSTWVRWTTLARLDLGILAVVEMCVLVVGFGRWFFRRKYDCEISIDFTIETFLPWRCGALAVLGLVRVVPRFRFLGHRDEGYSRVNCSLGDVLLARRAVFVRID